MPKEKISNLMSELHELFGTTEPSARQQKLMADLDRHMHNIDEAEPADPTPLETAELMLDDLGTDHPRTSAVLRELLDTLRNIGV